MKKDIRIALKTMAMKSRLANIIRVDLYKKKIEELSKDEKVELFNKWFKENDAMHWELIFYKRGRKLKARIEELRKAKV